MRNLANLPLAADSVGRGNPLIFKAVSNLPNQSSQFGEIAERAAEGGRSAPRRADIPPLLEVW